MSQTTRTIPDEIENARINAASLLLFRKRLWPYIRPYKALFALSIAFVLLVTVCAILTPWLLGKFVDVALLPKKLSWLAPFAIAYFAIDLVRALALYFQQYVLTLLGQRVLHNLRQDLLKQYQFYPAAEFTRTPTGRLVTRLVNDTASLQDLFSGGIAVAIGQLVIVTGTVLWLFVLNWRLALVSLGVFPLMALASKYFSGRIRSAVHHSRTALSRLNAYLAENISGMWLIQVFNRQEDFRARFKERSRLYTNAQIGVVETFAYFQPIITLLSSLSMSLLIWYSGFASLKTTISLGLLVSFISYLQALYAPIRDLTEKFNLFVAAMTACERIFEFIDRPSETPSTVRHESELNALPKLNGAVEFRNVWFRHSETSDWTLKDISFRIEPGEKIGIVGHTGAGKTTLISLLMRFYDPQKGQVVFGGHDVLKSERALLRNSIGYIQQDPFLFTGTIEENILLWQPDWNQVLKKLGPVVDLKKRVDEKGANLSVGEQQIIAFLRALIHNPSLFILDEATAHLDSMTEEWVEELIKHHLQDKTTLIIAHRHATLKRVDRIFVFEHGKLIESGTHSKLLSEGTHYRKFYEHQSSR